MSSEGLLESAAVPLAARYLARLGASMLSKPHGIVVRGSQRRAGLSRGFAIAAVLSNFALPYAAHHSAAIFDAKRPLTLQGTVKLFQWTNPHCWIQVMVPGQNVATEWSIEMGSPSQLYRKGWRPGTLKPGDRVTIVIYPTRDGTKGGEFISGTGPNGAPFKSASPRAQS